MLRKNLVWLGLLLGAIWGGEIGSQKNNPAPVNLIQYLPEPGEIKSWIPFDVPQIFRGEDLFLYINGGAEIYHEYGFRQVLAAEYRNSRGKSINLEIFEMSDSYSAYGIYTFKTGQKGKKLPLVENAWLEDYYLNFWKGNFLITLTGFDNQKETMKGLVTLATAVNKKIKFAGKSPDLKDSLFSENSVLPEINYIKGNIALCNYYQFDSKNIFGIREGIVGDYGSYWIFIFRYPDPSETSTWFGNSRKELEKNHRFKDFLEITEESFSLVDKNGKTVLITRNKNHIIIILGENKRNIPFILEKIQKNIR